MASNTIKAIALEMLKQHQKGEPFVNLSPEYQPKSFTDAYRAQEFFQKLSNRGPLGGFKIGLASKTQQELTGISHPLYGGIFKKEIETSPATIQYKKYLNLGLEFELAVTISHDIPKVHALFDEETILGVIESVHPAFEIAIDRKADYSNLDPISMVVDNVWCGGVILGPSLPNWKAENINKLTATLKWNNEPPKNVLVGDAFPLASLVWVINSLLKRNKEIPKGFVIMTGSVLKTRNAKIGDKISYDIGQLSQVNVDII